MLKRMNKFALILFGLSLTALPTQVQGQDQNPKPTKAIDEYDEIHVPAKRFDLILKRYPGGIFLRPAEWRRLLNKASSYKPTIKEKTVKAPVPYVIRSCNYQGRFYPKQSTLMVKAQSQVDCLDKGWHHLRLPRRNLVLGRVLVNGQDGELKEQKNGAQTLLLKGPGRFDLTFEFSVKVKRNADGPGGHFGFEMLPATAGSFNFTLPGRMSIQSSPATSFTEFKQKKDQFESAVSIGHGGTTYMQVHYKPEEIKVKKDPYVVAKKITVFDIGQTVIVLSGEIDLRISRHELDQVQLALPTGFTMRALSAEASPSWIQRGSIVRINLAEARTEKYRISFTAERAIKPGQIDLEPIQVLSAARETGLMAFSRRADVKLRVLSEVGLQRQDEVVLQSKKAGRYARVYSETPTSFQLSIQTRPVVPRVNLNISATYEFNEYEMKSRVIYRYNVFEGNIFAVRALVPSYHEVNSVQVWVSNKSNPSYDMRVKKVDGTREVSVELEHGVPAGQHVRLIVNLSRSIPEGLASMKSSSLPVFGGSPSETMDGYIGFAIDSEYSLRGEQIQGLTAIPAKEMILVGVAHDDLVLGYRINHAEHGGRFSINHRKTRLSVKSLLNHTVADQVLTTRARLSFEVKGAPTREIILFLPKGKGANAYIDGPPIKERGSIEGLVPDPSLERFRIRFVRPVSESFDLFLDFDTPIAAFHQSGVAKTNFNIPKIHVANVERENGVVAIFSSDSTQLTAKTSGLRPLEVTSVPKHPRVATIGRPLLAFNYVRPEFNLELEAQRYDDGAVLTALCERVTVQSSVGVDGVIRHSAGFRLKNLSHQFLGLQIPANAKLWSVVVDGTGVKPALDSKGAYIVPLPMRGAKSSDGSFLLKVVYDEHGDSLSRGSNARLQAPALLIPSKDGHIKVPVLKTEWSLAVPDDNRLVSVQGNVEGMPKELDRVLMFYLATRTKHFWSRHNLTSKSLWFALGLFLLLAAYKLVFSKLIVFGRANPKTLFFIIAAIFWIALMGFCVFSMMLGGRDGMPGMTPKAMRKTDSKADYGAKYDDSMKIQSAADTADRASSRFAGASSTTLSIAGAKNQMPRDMYESEARKREDKRLKDSRRRGAYDEKKREKRRPRKKGKPRPKPKPKPTPMPVTKKAVAKMPAPSKPAQLNKETFTRQYGKRPKQDPNVMSPSEEDSAEGYSKVAELVPGTSSPRINKPFVDKSVEEDKEAKDKDNSGLLDYEEGPRDGLRSLVFQMPAVGRVYTMSRPGGEAWVDFSMLNESSYRGLAMFSVILGFIAALVIPLQWDRFNYVGLLLFISVAGTALSLTFTSVTFVAASNGAITGFGLAGLVHGFFFAMKRIAAARAKSLKARPEIRIVAALAFMALVMGGSGEAQAQAQDKKLNPRVFVPYNPKTMEAQDRVFVPKKLFNDLMKKAYPKPIAAKKIVLPAQYTVGAVKYDARLDGSRLDLNIQLALNVYSRWVEVPLGLDGVAVRFDKKDAVLITGGKSSVKPRLKQKNGQLSLIFEDPGQYKVSIRAVVSKRSSGFVFSPIPVDASEFILKTSDLKNRILMNLKKGGQSERIVGKERIVRAFIGQREAVQIAVTPPEVLSLTGSSDASARNVSLFALDRGVIRVFSSVTLDIVGSGWEGFRFEIPKGMSIVQVVGTGLREWQTRFDAQSKKRVLELFLRSARSGKINFFIEAESLLKENAKSAVLPEIVSLGVKREFGVVALSPADGLKIRIKSSGSFFQMPPNQARGLDRLLARIPGRSIDRAYRYGSRPTGLNIDFVHEATVMKARSRIFGLVSREDFKWQAKIDFTMTKGRAHELAFAIPSEMNCQEVSLTNLGAVGDWREEIIDRQKYVLCNLKKGLAGRFSVNLVLSRSARGEKYQLTVPDIRPSVLERNPTLRIVRPRSMTGSVVLAVKEDGINLQPIGELQGWDPNDVDRERHWLTSSCKGSPRLAYTIRGQERYGRVEVSRLAPVVKGAFTMHAQVFHEVVRYRVHLAYEIERSGSKSFSFLLPSRFSDRIEINAPNRREVVVRDLKFAGKDVKEYRIELQSAVRGLYEMTFVLEELAGKDGLIDFPELVMTNVERSRGYILVEKNAKVNDELVLESKKDVGQVNAANVPALPPGRTPFSFIAAYKVQQMQKGVTDWSLVYKLKKVRVGQGPEAVIHWVRLTSVVYKDGRVQNRARYRVQNRRLQFLALQLPEKASVWSLRVAGKAKRVFQSQTGELLLPLPKRVEADLAFDVEVIYKTHLGSELGFLSKFQPKSPKVVTEGLAPKQSFWSVYMPEEFDYTQVKTNMTPTLEAQQQTIVFERSIQEVAQLSNVANKDGQSAQIFDDNLQGNMAIIDSVLSNAKQKQGYAFNEAKSGKLSGQQKQSVTDNGIKLKKLEQEWGALKARVQKERRSRVQKRRQGRAQTQVQKGQDVTLGGNKYMQSFSNDWNINPAVLKNKRAKWVGLSNQSEKQMENLALFALDNDKVRNQIRQGVDFQGKSNFSNRKRLESAVKQEYQRRLVNQQFELNDAETNATTGEQQAAQLFRSNVNPGNRTPRFGADQLGGRLEHIVEGQQGGFLSDRRLKGTKMQFSYGKAQSGLLSMDVPFEIVGTPFHFEKTDGELELTMRAVPKSFFENVKNGIGIMALFSLLLLIPHFSAFQKTEEKVSILRGILSLVFLAGIAAFISIHWLTALATILGVAAFQYFIRESN